jgi:S-(hydroxymethyl)glutathione dehydrogenase / alcohol dehydrogenase
VLFDGLDLQVVDVTHDQPIGREILIKTLAAGLCHSDAHVLDGVLVRPLPMVLGHEGAGVVEAVGPDVRNIAVGDHVVTCLVMGCGECLHCVNGELGRCKSPEQIKRTPSALPRLALTHEGTGTSQMANIGALSEYIVVDERGVVRIDADVPMTTAAILGCAVVTGLGAALNVAKVQPGETVAVIGCGGVGLSVIQGARIAGASRIIAVDVSSEKLEIARTCGATDLVNAGDGDPVAAVRALTGEGVDHAFEVVGRESTVVQAFAMAANGRKAYALGIHPDDAAVSVPAMGLRRGKSLVGVFMGDTNPTIDIPKYVQYWREGKLDLDAMISHVVPLDKVNEGFAMMANGVGARTVISFTSFT